MIVANEDRRQEGSSSRGDIDRTALGALINIAGRQRMLSHRAVMFLALSQMPDGQADDLLVSAGEALASFEAGVRLLLHGDPEQAIPPLFSDRVRALLSGRIEGHGRGAEVLASFGARGAACLQRLKAGEGSCGGEIRALADLAGAVLLPLLNGIVAAFEQDLAEALRAEAERAADIRLVMTGALDDIEQTATRIRLIAFNALIEAARAGDSGRAFSVIAEEIKNLGAQTREESAKMQAAMARLFAA
ncbi:methyl-accepting chemotaxis protein [Phenylobacterium sp. LjRoot225]|uniref:methyl-accepting chemotaxis protein n=1 Tax=Phenylobacterium sp. LjRoot225 TaxID=3342285 RepID=UPI003ED0987B